jgi:hypothetical protein
MNDVTRILGQIEDGDGQAAEKLLPLVDDELRKLAAQKMAQEKPGQMIHATWWTATERKSKSHCCLECSFDWRAERRAAACMGSRSCRGNRGKTRFSAGVRCRMPPSLRGPPGFFKNLGKDARIGVTFSKFF